VVDFLLLIELFSLSLTVETL